MKYIEDNFTFSILKVLPNTKTANEVIEREEHCKIVIKTRAPYGLNFN